MENNVFEEPVFIVVGLGFPREVSTVAEAYAILSEWPHHRRGKAHDRAMKVLRAALDGSVDAQTARSSFVAFARKTGMLMPESDVVAAQAMDSFARPLRA